MKLIPILPLDRYIEKKEEPQKMAPLSSANNINNIKDIDFNNIHSVKNLDIIFNEVEKQIGNYRSGFRHNYVQRFAALCNRLGISKTSCLKYAHEHFSKHPATNIKENIFKEGELVGTIHDTYTRYKNQHESWVQHNPNIDLSKTPTIPEKVYNNLPPILKEYVNIFSVQREKDISLIGATTAMSGCFPYNLGIYDYKEVSPNLYSFIVAPPASGKGQLSTTFKLTTRIDYIFEEEWEDALAEKRMAEQEGEKYEMPPRKMLYIPANSSKSAMISQLEVNGGYGIIFESEADSLGLMLDKEWASFSDALRKAFHHETISFLRKTNKEYIRIDNPRLSILLSGTKDQLYKIVSSVENGLFSRFIFYIYNADPKWKKDLQSKDFGKNDNLLRDLRGRLFDIHNKLKANSFILSDQQWKDFDCHFELLLTEVNQKYSENARSIVTRMGFIAYRIMFLFTLLEMDKENNIESVLELKCSDKTFNTAIELSKVLIQHSLYVYSLLSKEGYRQLSEPIQNLYKALPEEFTRKVVDEAAEELGITYKTAEKYINDMLKQNLIKRIKHGNYKKVNEL